MRTRKRLLIALIVLTALALGGSAILVHAEEDNQNHATAVLINTSGNEVGQATFTQNDGSVEAHVEVHDLSPGFHGFHVHEKGLCDPTTVIPFSSAGNHLSLVAGQTHPHHSGDLPSLLVNEDGTGEATMVTDRFTVADLTKGTALIVHRDADNFANIPSRYSNTGPDSTTLKNGDSGPRIACGVIQHTEDSNGDPANIIAPAFLQALRTFLDSAKLLTRILISTSTSLPF